MSLINEVKKALGRSGIEMDADDVASNSHASRALDGASPGHRSRTHWPRWRHRTRM